MEFRILTETAGCPICILFPSFGPCFRFWALFCTVQLESSVRDAIFEVSSLTNSLYSCSVAPFHNRHQAESVVGASKPTVSVIIGN